MFPEHAPSSIVVRAALSTTLLAHQIVVKGTVAAVESKRIQISSLPVRAAPRCDHRRNDQREEHIVDLGRRERAFALAARRSSPGDTATGEVKFPSALGPPRDHIVQG